MSNDTDTEYVGRHRAPATVIVWCENVNAPSHGNGPHSLQENCRYPHQITPEFVLPAVGHPLTVHD